MIEEIVTISKFKATCLSLLKKVKQTGRPVLVTRRGEPVALIVPPPEPAKLRTWLGMYQEKGRITGDIVSPVTSPKDWEILRHGPSA